MKSRALPACLPVSLIGALLFAAPAAAKERGDLIRTANPSSVIARELEFAKAAQDKGQWTAFREFAAEDAIMFVPKAVLAQDWLKGRPNPPVAVRWQPAEVWSSCDGSLVVSQGPWQLPDSVGYFTTIWQRQGDGSYKWVLDHGNPLEEPRAVPEMIPAHVAECPASGRPRRLGSVAGGGGFDVANPEGRSGDGTVMWAVTTGADGSKNLSIEWQQDGAMQPLLTDRVVAPAAGR